MTQKLYTVSTAVERLILDEAGNPVDGYHIDFMTRSGIRGYVNIPKARYTKELAQQLIEAEAKKLEELLTL